MKKLTLTIPLIAILALSGCGDLFANEPTKQEKCEDLAQTAFNAMTFRQSGKEKGILISQNKGRGDHLYIINAAYKYYDIREDDGDKVMEIQAYKTGVYMGCME